MFDDNMVDPLSAKLGEFDINDPANATRTPNGDFNEQGESSNENIYIPAVTKESLESEWQQMFGTENYKKDLQNLALTGRLRDRRFRGVCWRLFLGCLSDDVGHWSETVCESRTRYENLKSMFFIDPYSSKVDEDNVQVFDPLSQEIDSPWSQYFEDKKLTDLIYQDLNRLFPGMHYFQSKKIKDVLLHILFCYAKMNPNVGYKQGMHEVLAPLLFVLENESELFQFLENSDNEVMRDLINPEFLESDAFCLFEHLMEIIEPWYVRAESPAHFQKKAFDPHGKPFMETQSYASSPPTAIIRKLNKIQESMLKRYDLVLYNHLREMQIEPQFYGLRWVRLLYGREFATMEDILTLWDGLFADGATLDLVEYVYLSLICSKRKKLLASDHSGCLTVLMKTPYCKRDAKIVVQEAKHMRDTKLDPRKKLQGFYQPLTESKVMATNEFPTGEPTSTKFSSARQNLLRGAKQIASKKAPEPNTRKIAQAKRSEKTKERIGEERKRPVELKANSKSAPSSHMFPHNEDDEDLFTTSQRSVRSPSSTFLSKLSSKVRHPTRTDLTTLQQDHERLQEQISHFKAEIDKLQSISIYCGTKMDSYINSLQDQITHDEKCMDVVYLSLAGLKQVRDILKGTLSFQSSTIEQDTEFSHIDTAISSLTPNTSTENTLPGSLPVPLLADFGHFEKQSEKHILVESTNDETTNDENTDDTEINANDSHAGTLEICKNEPHVDPSERYEGKDERTTEEQTDGKIQTEDAVDVRA
ncbi:TBC1 domain family member 5-like isoform X2 [Dendronephthya gigantea]|uniref:TBC1 domain family member 5-like isoform X2 n=1 Tax=Dendronephthya gigantea TaxID=151771 RepID=UPI00106B5F87|nr:TBC1 domain family member 5-like isoform X2 [Dendronephthya gigantea]